MLMQKVAKEYTVAARTPVVAERLAAAARPLTIAAGKALCMCELGSRVQGT